MDEQHRDETAAQDDGGDHHGQDGGRETLTAGEAQRSLDDDQAQHLPAMAQNNASDVDKIAGIVAQTRSDLGMESEQRIGDVLRQRLEQSGIDLPDAEIAELAGQIAHGEAS